MSYNSNNQARADSRYDYRDPDAVVDDEGEEDPEADEVDYPDTPYDSDEDNHTSSEETPQDENEDVSWIHDLDHLGISGGEEESEGDGQSYPSSLFRDDGHGNEIEREYQSSERGEVFYRNKLPLQWRFSIKSQSVRAYHLIWDEQEHEYVYEPYSEDPDD